MAAARAVALAVLLVGACRDASTPFQPESHDGASRVVPGQYIVVFRDTVADPVDFAQSRVSPAQSGVNAQGGTLLHTYSSALKGFAARLPDATVATLRQDPRVAYVEPDQEVRVAGSQQMDANGDPWGLDRIDQRALPLSGTYTYMSTGAGVHVYLIDTGIWTAHREFGGRADIVYDVSGGDGQDCFGHGTAVAGVVGAATYGVAKGVFLHGVRVYDFCNPSGLVSNVIAGVDWVTANHKSPAVASLPLEAAPDAALAAALKKLWDSGVFIATTGGNYNVDACTQLSGATPFAVAASTRADAKADFSNWGSCVKIYAPGVDIKTTWPAGVPGTSFAVPHGDSTATVSGTSFAMPHVAGVAALYKATFGDAPSDTVAKWILNNATPGVITGNPAGTPNLLLYSAALPQPAPVANFTFSCTGLTCSFDASSSTAQTTATYSWSWGDAATGTGKTATHTYGTAGSYSVTLMVTDGGGSNSVSKTVTVSPANQPPSAAFTSSCSGLTCNFTSTSSDPDGSVASYSWTFGDGGTSTAQNPSHTYGAGGSYSVTLTVTDNQGAQSAPTSKTVTVTAPNQPPTANFTFSCSGLSCSFTSTSSDPDGSIASYNWTFGDGSTSTAQNPSHTYGAGGSYTVTLRVTDNQGAQSTTTSKTVTVTAPNQPPTANFTFSCSGLSCSFTSTSSDPDGSIASYSWTVGDGSTSTAQNPSHTYGAVDSYTVTLRVTDNQGATSAPTSKTVTVTAPNQQPTANFTFSCSGLSCSFTSTSSDPDGSVASYSWTFGDGGTATAQNPSHTYGTGGSYTVTLRVTDNQGATSSPVSKTVTVTAPNSPPIVNAGPDEGMLTGLFYSLSASFSDANNDGPWSYTISWGDGSSSSGSTPSQGTISASHTYLLLGSYTITVRVTDSHGASGSDSKVVTFIL